VALLIVIHPLVPGGYAADDEDIWGSTVTRLIGRWRIVAMDVWDQDAIDLMGPGFIEFTEDGMGEFGFVAVRGQLDCRSVERDGRPSIEFSWEGDDDGDQVSGRGWATLTEEGEVTGHLFIHLGDDSDFRATPFGPSTQDRP
jgi:hypothetical protein